MHTWFGLVQIVGRHRPGLFGSWAKCKVGHNLLLLGGKGVSPALGVGVGNGVAVGGEVGVAVAVGGAKI